MNCICVKDKTKKKWVMFYISNPLAVNDDNFDCFFSKLIFTFLTLEYRDILTRRASDKMVYALTVYLEASYIKKLNIFCWFIT